MLVEAGDGQHVTGGDDRLGRLDRRHAIEYTLVRWRSRRLRPRRRRMPSTPLAASRTPRPPFQLTRRLGRRHPLAAVPADRDLRPQRRRPVRRADAVPAAQAGVRPVRQRARHPLVELRHRRHAGHVPFGYFADRMRRTRVISWGTAAWGATMIFTGRGLELRQPARRADDARRLGPVRQPDVAVAARRLLPDGAALEGDERLPDRPAARDPARPDRGGDGDRVGLALGVLLPQHPGVHRGDPRPPPPRAGARSAGPDATAARRPPQPRVGVRHDARPPGVPRDLPRAARSSCSPCRRRSARCSSAASARGRRRSSCATTTCRSSQAAAALSLLALGGLAGVLLSGLGGRLPDVPRLARRAGRSSAAVARLLALPAVRR